MPIKKEGQEDIELLWNLGKCFYELQSKECIIYFNQCKLKQVDMKKKDNINKIILEVDKYFEGGSIEMRNSTMINHSDQETIKAIVANAKKEKE